MKILLFVISMLMFCPQANAFHHVHISHHRSYGYHRAYRAPRVSRPVAKSVAKPVAKSVPKPEPMPVAKPVEAQKINEPSHSWLYYWVLFHGNRNGCDCSQYKNKTDYEKCKEFCK